MTSPAAIVRAARIEITAAPMGERAAIWERHAAEYVAARPAAVDHIALRAMTDAEYEAYDAVQTAWERHAVALDRLGERCGAI